MLSENLKNSTSYDIFYKFWKKARVYYTLSISRGGQAPAPPPPGFATDLGVKKFTIIVAQHILKCITWALFSNTMCP